MLATNLKKTGRFQISMQDRAMELRPANLNDLRRCLDPASSVPLPIRPRGAGTATNDCNDTSYGTVLDTGGLDQIVAMDPDNGTVTVQAGVRIADLVDELAAEGLELVGAYELQGRSVGGATAAPCFGPSIGNRGSYFSSHVVAMKIVTPQGRILRIEPGQHNLLGAFRMSYGLLGVICEVTLRVRPIRIFSASHRRVSFEKFAGVIDTLSNADVGFKFYLMPYRDRVYLDLRRYETPSGRPYSVPWKLKDWGESTVLPNLFRSLNRVVPIRSMKYNLMDSISEATQNLVNTRLVAIGSNAASQSSKRSRAGRRHRYSSTWCFPAANFSIVVGAYRDFCAAIYARSGYRLDMPAVGYRLCRDPSAILSPSYDEAMIALTVTSTQADGWEDFVIDLAEFAERCGGIPLFSHSRALRAEYAIQTYSERLDFFRHMRRRLDADNRLLNPFLAQFCQ